MRNAFVYALGLGATVYILLRCLGFLLQSILSIVSTFATWYRVYGLPHAEKAAIAAFVIYLLWAAVTTSRRF